MPTYKDEKSKTWSVSFYYKSWNGERKRKHKRGFSTQREAKEFEREFLKQYAGQPEMTFKSLYELYKKDLSDRIRNGTKGTKDNMFETHILPYFEDMKVNEITPGHIREWQNIMLSKKQKNGKPYSKTYLRTINSQLNAIFNYAVCYKNLFRSPCISVEPIGSKKAAEMQFWTLDEFNKFIACENKPAYHLAFMLLFWGGFRVGEILALKFSKINRIEKSIKIDETYHGNESIGPPKSTNGIRTVLLPDFVYDELVEYVDTIYGIKEDDRVFYFGKNTLNGELDRVAPKAGVKRIRIHDLRHSHVSLLIELGFGTHAIAKRIGDTPETVDKTYAHLYPQAQNRIVNSLNSVLNNSQEE